MVHNWLLRSKAVATVVIAAGLFFLVWTVFSCKPFKELTVKEDLTTAKPGMDTAKHRWLSWNILFKENTGYTSRNQQIAAIQQLIIDSIRLSNPSYSARFVLYFCPCDSLLYNLGATPIDGSGESVVTPPSSPKPPGGSGDVLYVSYNNTMALGDSSNNQISLRNNQIPTGDILDISPKILAVIDTGIDTTLFAPDIQRLIWVPGTGTQRLFNFVSADLENFTDDHPGRHGTVVTALALNAMNNSAMKPRLMILKALDKEKKGTSFSVSCALSYAIKNNATAINTSLGYYETEGRVDSVLSHYTGLCGSVRPKPIIVFAAAGNMPGIHNQTMRCNPPTTANRLTDTRLFYPACFSATMNHVISVADVNVPQGTGCRYQNNSSEYVSLGVMNTHDCCGYSIPPLFGFFEGSSYATPIASGKGMSCLAGGAGSGSVIDCIESARNVDAALAPAIKDGKYIRYAGFQ